jgi:hypothetical protein
MSVKVKIEVLTADIKKQINNGIDQLFEKKIKELEIDSCPPDVFFEILKDKGIDIDSDEWDTNGWQYDYWQNFTHNDIKYQVSGGGYYGKLSLTEYRD